MKTTLHIFLAATAAFLSQPGSLRAAVYTKASITQVYKDVKLLEPTGVRPAKVSDTIAGQQSVKTGVQSRAELIFDDNSMTRLGANTIFSFQQGSRELELKQGTILFEVPKRAGGASIRTAAVTAAITGTTGFYEYSPKAGKDGIIKFGILEGGATLRIRRPDSGIKVGVSEPQSRFSQSGGNRIGQVIHIGPGEMIIASAMPKNFDAIEVVHFDIAKFRKTCGLITKMGGLTAGGNNLVDREIAAQEKLLNRTGELIPTDVFFPGGGTQLFVDSQVDRRLVPLQEAAAPGQNGQGQPPAGNQIGNRIVAPNPYVIKQGTQIVTNPHITTDGITNTGRVYRNASLDGPLPIFLYGSVQPFDLRIRSLPAALADSSLFEFSNLLFTGAPTFTAMGSARTVALLSDGVITSGAPGGAFGMDALDHLAFLTKNGPIILGPELNFQSSRTDNPLPFASSLAFTLYARGPGSDLIFASNVNFAERNLNMFAGRNVEIDGTIAMISPGEPLLRLTPNINVISGNDFILGSTGHIDAPFVQIDARDVAGAAGSSLAATRLVINTVNPANLTQSGGSFFVNALPFAANGLRNLSVSSRNGVNVPGSFSFQPGPGLSFLNLNSSSGDVTVNGNLIADTLITIIAAGNLVLGSSGTITAPQFAVIANDVVGNGGTGIQGNGANISIDIQQPLAVSTFGNLLQLNGLSIDQTSPMLALSLSSPGGVSFPSNVTLNSAPLNPGAFILRSIRDVSIDGSLTARGSTVLSTSRGFLMGNLAAGIFLDGFDATQGSGAPGGSGGFLRINATGNIIVDGTSDPEGGIYAGTGANDTGVSYGGAGGNVYGTSQNGVISVRRPIEVSYSDFPGGGGRTSASGGNIVLRSKRTSGLAINVTNTGALRSLLNAAAPGQGGVIQLFSSGGDIRVAGQIKADRGRVRIENDGPAGVIDLTAGHDIHANAVRIGALGDNGVLNIGSGVIDATTQIKLFAGGSNGAINFVGNSTISGNAITSIAAKTVTVNAGVNLRIDGRAATFYTDVPRYNGAGVVAGSGFGTVTGTAPASTVPYANRPSFP